MAEDAEGADGITEPACDLAGGFLVDEVGAEGLVLALQGELWGEEELLVGGSAYLIGGTEQHNPIMLEKHSMVKMFYDHRSAKHERLEMEIYESRYGKRWLAGQVMM
jgi:hypothetical protein